MLPELPIAYAAEAQPLLNEPLLYASGAEDFEQDEPPPEAPSAPPERRTGSRRRLAGPSRN